MYEINIFLLFCEICADSSVYLRCGPQTVNCFPFLHNLYSFSLFASTSQTLNWKLTFRKGKHLKPYSMGERGEENKFLSALKLLICKWLGSFVHNPIFGCFLCSLSSSGSSQLYWNTSERFLKGLNRPCSILVTVFHFPL